MTIDTNVAVEFEPEAMRAQEPDAAAARALFTELEFTTLVQDFLTESIELGETDYREAKVGRRSRRRLLRRRASRAACWRLRWNRQAPATPPPKTEEAEEAGERAALAVADAQPADRHAASATHRDLRRSRQGADRRAR